MRISDWSSDVCSSDLFNLMKILSNLFFAAFLVLSVSSTAIYAQEISPLEGRWDMVIAKDGQELPSWLEIRHSGTHTLVGRFVYAVGDRKSTRLNSSH